MHTFQNDQLSYIVCEKLSTNFFADFMGKDFKDLVNIMLLVFPLIKSQDRVLFEFFTENDIEPFFITRY